MEKLSKALLGCVLVMYSGVSFSITPQEMVNRILQVGEEVVQEGNVVEFNLRGIALMLVYDQGADRMRLISPIAELKDVGDDLLMMAMEANFHSALDARYAISNDVVWSTFIHPLADLTPALFDSAMSQVAIAHATFGGDFTSGALVFPNRSNTQ